MNLTPTVVNLTPFEVLQCGASSARRRVPDIMRPSNDDASPLALHPALVVEDDPRMQERLTRVLAAVDVPAAAVALAGAIAQAQARFAPGHFALALIDLELPDGSGIDLIRELHWRDAGMALVVVSTFATQDLILAALQAGATGYLLKERDDAELVAALRSLQRGGAPIDPFVAKHILRVLGLVTAPAVATAPVAAEEDSADRLTRREEEILHLVAQGLISREIAQRLSRSTLTIEGHIKNIFRKLQVSTRTQAIYQARALGLLR